MTAASILKRLGPATLAALAAFAAPETFAERTETPAITVDLQLDNADYVAGERIRAVVDVANSSPEKVSVGYANSEDILVVEVFRSDGMVELDRIGRRDFTARFRVDANEGQKLETFLGDHYALRAFGKYLARPVLVHGGKRYEGQLRAFGVVPGMKIASALQMFSNRAGLRREFELRTWSRRNTDHLFLVAFDQGPTERKWATTDLGPLMRLKKPTVSILPSGEVIVLHCYDRHRFCRSEFWSLPDALEFNKREFVMDPDSAGSERIKELYQASGGVKPVSRPWWKIW